MLQSEAAKIAIYSLVHPLIFIVTFPNLIPLGRKNEMELTIVTFNETIHFIDSEGKKWELF